MEGDQIQRQLLRELWGEPGTQGGTHGAVAVGVPCSQFLTIASSFLESSFYFQFDYFHLSFWNEMISYKKFHSVFKNAYFSLMCS